MTTRRRIFLSVVAAMLMAGIASVTNVAGAESEQQLSREGEVAQQVIDQLTNNSEISLDQINLDGLGPPPWTSFVPNRDPKAVQAWKLLAQRFPALRSTGLAPSVDLQDLVISENEPAGTVGQNDTPSTGEPITGFGTGEGETDFVRVLGTLFTPAPPPDCSSAEDDGAINLASPTDLNPDTQVQLCEGFLGDGPHGETTGDFDFFAMNNVAAGQTLVIEVIASRETQEEPPTTISIFNSAGQLIGSTDDDGSESSFLELVAPEEDSYFAVVAGIGNTQSDPFDSSAGNGATSIGAYEVFVVNLSPFEGPPPSCFSEEEDGSINDAIPTVLDPEDSVQLCSGFIGDSAHEEGGGDFDFVAANTVEAGRTVIAEVVPSRVDPLEPATTVAIYNSAGEKLASADDPGGTDGPISLVQVVAPETDTYFFAISGVGNVAADPFDPSSGSGSDSVGPYEMYIGNLEEPVDAGLGLTHWRNRMDEPPAPEGEEGDQPADGEEEPPAGEEPDADFFLVDLEPGDVITAAFEPFGVVEIYNPDGTLAIGSTQTASFIYPATSPLRHLGSLGADHVAKESGTYAIGISQSSGPYEGEFRVTRTGRQAGTSDDVQIIYLDFDGGALSPSLFDPFAPSEELPLSPMVDFFSRWDLDPSEENVVIDAVMTEVAKELGDHLRAQGTYGDRDASGIPGELDIELRNSRDHQDIWGQKNVSRVIIGGSIDEFGIPTIGIAQSIDPGNLDAEESAVVLLDVLSGDPEEFGDSSLNSYEFADTTSKAEMVGAGIGVIVAHEIGHFIGNWHTETGNEVFNIMDAGGDLAGTFGVGPDRIFGTEDDIDVHFVSDVFNSQEGFLGIEDTEARTGFALLTGPLADNQPPQGLTLDQLTSHYKFSQADAQVLRLYLAFFNRQPDPGGANYWVAVRFNGESLQSISGFFTQSQEFANNYAGTSNEEFLERVYTNVLGRDYDQSGFDYWLNLLETGQLDRGGVVQWISLNGEFVDANPYGGV